MSPNKRLFFLLVLCLGMGCGTSRQFVAVPTTVDKDRVERQTIEIKAERFHFTPEELHVKVGTLVHLNITAVDGTHGFKMSSFGIDERIDKGETRTVEFYPSEKGEYSFSCSHFCGLGHLWMTGKVIVEQRD